MKRVHTIAELRAELARLRTRAAAPAASPAAGAGGGPHRHRYGVALVPTMGYLHEGHLSLVDRAREVSESVVMSIFVNPLQFGPHEDLDRYPRDLERDARLAEERGVDLLFAPAVSELYRGGEPAIRVLPGPLGDRLCGRYRPGHFEGVLTVVAKLFNLVQPDLAVFGQKDYQQAVLIRRMVADLDFPLDIDVAPTVREADGLAMSSRNAYLSDTERRQATALYRALSRALERFRRGERDRAELIGVVERTVAEEPGVRLQYVDLVAPDSVDPVNRAVPGATLAIAAFVGGTRLIDNITLN